MSNFGDIYKMVKNIILNAQKDAIFWLLIFIGFLLILHFCHRLFQPKKYSKKVLANPTEHTENDAVGIGQAGENAVFRALTRTNGRHKKIINDIVLKIGVDRTAQIDHILINRAGIFVIETKNYKGRIYGSSDRLYWCQYLGNRKYNFYNPMKQNRAHVKRLQEVLGDQYPYYSIVVFAQNNISHIGIENVINLKDLTGYIQTHNKKVLKKTEIRKIYRKLNRIQKKKHNHIFWANDAA